MIVQIDGVAASAASVIAMAGTTVRMSPTALMMVHNPWTTAMGDAEDMRKAIDLLSEVKESIINAYQIKTGLSRAKLSNIMDAETWLNAHKAKELGFCDEVLYEESDESADEPGAKPDFIFSAKTAALVLMNKVMESIPKSPAEPEHPPDPIDTPDADTAPEGLAPVTPDNRVKASDLEKRLALLK